MTIILSMIILSICSHAVIVSAGSCTGDFDCSLAGKCKGGRCECDTWTTGPQCEALNLQPLRSPADLSAAVQPVDGWTRWGSSVAKDENGTYHLFSAEMADKCSLGVWGFKSTVIHSTSNSGPTGPFTRQGVAIGPEAHNPVLSRAVDGTWLLWTCGCPHSPANKSCARSELTCPGGAQAAWTTTVYSSSSLWGPWVPHVDLLGHITHGRLGSQNVSPIMAEDGSVMLMFKGPDNNTEASIASAPHWRGPYTLLHTNIFAKYYAQNITNEDCWWWRTKDGFYHALSHRMTPADRGSPASGGHAFATSLDNWHYASTPAYTTTVDVQGSAPLHLKRRERPQLLLSPDGEPKVLYTAVMTETDSPTFTFAQFLG